MTSIPLEKLIKDICDIFGFIDMNTVTYEGLLNSLRKTSEVSFKLAENFLEISDIVDATKDECFTTINKEGENNDNT